MYRLLYRLHSALTCLFPMMCGVVDNSAVSEAQIAYMCMCV